MLSACQFSHGESLRELGLIWQEFRTRDAGSRDTKNLLWKKGTMLVDSLPPARTFLASSVQRRSEVGARAGGNVFATSGGSIVSLCDLTQKRGLFFCMDCVDARLDTTCTRTFSTALARSHSSSLPTPVSKPFPVLCI
jgi:hypothetical protein